MAIKKSMKNSRVKLFLILLDIIIVLSSLFAAFLIRKGFNPHYYATFWPSFAILVVLTIIVCGFSLFYTPRIYINTTKMVMQTIPITLLVIMLYILLQFILKHELLEQSSLILLLYGLFFITLFLIVRVAMTPSLIAALFKPEHATLISDNPDKSPIPSFFSNRPFLGIDIKEIKQTMDWDFNAQTVIIERDFSSYNEVFEFVKHIPASRYVFLYSPLFARIQNVPLFTYVESIPLIHIKHEENNHLYCAVKRILDIFVAALSIIILSPVLLICSVLVGIGTKGPVIFKQERHKSRDKTFTFLKFRSMKADTSHDIHQDYMKKLIKGENNKKNTFKLSEDPRVTKIGRFLRKTSMDELPQLFNVLKGDLSIVGPRPPIPYELEHYSEWHKKRLDCKQGLTGLWQVFGRSRLPFDEAVFLDIYYCLSRDILWDIYLIIMTIPALFKGAY